MNMANLATLCGIVMGLIPGAQEILFSDAGALRFLGSGFEILSQPAVALMTLIVFSNLGRQLWLQRYPKKPRTHRTHRTHRTSDGKEGEEMEETLSVQMAIIFGLTRIVLIGTIQLALTSALLYVLPSSSRLGMPERLLLLIECFSPSANLVIVVCQQAGNSKGAAALATGYLIQYVLFIPSLLAGASVAIWVAHSTNT